MHAAPATALDPAAAAIILTTQSVTRQSLAGESLAPGSVIGRGFPATTGPEFTGLLPQGVSMARAANPHLQSGLVEAAEAVFAEHGLAAAKVSDITTRAGVSKGAFYLHFESKEALYEQICRSFLATITDRLRNHEMVLCDLTLSPLELFEKLGDADQALMDLLWDHRQPLSMILHGAIGTPSARLADEFIESIQAVMFHSISDHVQSHGIAMQFRPEFMAAVATGIIVMYARRVAAAHGQPDSERPDIGQDTRRFRRIMMLGSLLPAAQLDQMLLTLFSQSVPAQALRGMAVNPAEAVAGAADGSLQALADLYQGTNATR